MAERMVIRRPTFHEHLDECRQCREHPHELCPVGANALRREALAVLSMGRGTPKEGE